MREALRAGSRPLQRLLLLRTDRQFSDLAQLAKFHARGVRYLNLLTGEECYQPASVVVLAAFTLTNTKLLLTGKIGRPYDAATGEGVVGKNFCYQANSGIPLFFKDRWINPFLAAGCTGTLIDEFNDDNFDHTGLGFLGGGYIGVNVTSGRPINARRLPPGTPRSLPSRRRHFTARSSTPRRGTATSYTAAI